ncbi:uncharacterized protein PGTG_18122 [Puccinia graminis f. sp. tritici CRL 75-36-700-3]|uniref:Uncharacterized protein n=1 Tax=Puccinia graminis f. sp. tritici (strain CRL 75-36-700-3 / race SCCL) TaxID=418459 RepID=E3L6Q0_PUCGT|nr:uncharacterized protein PGTG_18122 [Puccinia graminis f. sp. tritici CRL 75-36-700-3]EFP92225.2 hypothetical protein PGTG_18122 [Puccinia graminis f. sp. tritici CRL 75-36-700-3]
MSIEREVKLLRQELYQLQIKLKDVELKLLERTTLESTWNRNDYPSLVRNDLASSRSSIAGKVVPAVRKGNHSTLRSRSFKVMRHLINVVDVSSTASEPKKKRIIRDSLRDPIASASPATKLKASARPKKATNTPPKGPSALLSSQKDSCVSSISVRPLADPRPEVEPKSKPQHLTPPRNPKDNPSTISATPRHLHPKRPRRVQLLNDLSTADKEANFKTSQAVSKLPITKEIRTDAQSRLEEVIPKAAEVPTVTKTPGDILPEVFLSNDLQLRCGRFSLLKFDPDVLNLIPTSVKEKRFMETTTLTDIQNLPHASEILIRRQILGLWEWKEGTSKAVLHEFKTPERGATISTRGYKFVGFAWKGHLGQQPPRIEELHEDISQGADTLRWYWFKDLWLLFYFD